jgi:hypothetical protein
MSREGRKLLRWSQLALHMRLTARGYAMRTYRLYFLDDQSVGRSGFDADYRLYFLSDHVVGQFDFQADDDDRAVETAEIIFDACSDSCRSWQIWEGDVFLVSGPLRLHGAQLRTKGLTERRQEHIVECEEAILRSEWAIASSERLMAELDEFKAGKRGPCRYSELS